MNESIIQETAARRQRALAPNAARFHQITRLRRVVSTGGEADPRCSLDAGAECYEERRHFLGTEGDGGARMEQSQQPQCSGAGANRERPHCADAPGRAARLQPVRLHAVPARLRSKEDRCIAWLLPCNRLHEARRILGRPAHRSKTGAMAESEKDANGIPATGQRSRISSHHGTKAGGRMTRKPGFVPARYETPGLRQSLRPATGHLYRFTMYQRNQGAATTTTRARMPADVANLERAGFADLGAADEAEMQRFEVMP